MVVTASGRNFYSLNPTATKVEGQLAFAAIANLPVVPESLTLGSPSFAGYGIDRMDCLVDCVLVYVWFLCGVLCWFLCGLLNDHFIFPLWVVLTPPEALGDVF